MENNFSDAVTAPQSFGKDDVMTTSYQRIPLSDNIAFSEILDSKLKTNHLRIQFLQPLSEQTAAACALAGSLEIGRAHV